VTHLATKQENVARFVNSIAGYFMHPQLDQIPSSILWLVPRNPQKEDGPSGASGLVHHSAVARLTVRGGGR
jgi:hypothetical protein